MSTTLSLTETFFLSALSLPCIWAIATFHGDGEPLIASLAFSGIAFAFTYCLIRWLGDVFIRAGLKGKDMSKVRKVEMYVLCLMPTLAIQLNPRLQSRDYGCSLCSCLHSYDHCFHPFSVLQGHCRSYFWRRQQRRRGGA